MPELPEVEHVKRGLEKYIIGRTIVDVTFSDKVIEGKKHHKETIVKGLALQKFKAGLLNQTIRDLKRRSKYLIFELDEGMMVSHLGMSGAYFVVKSIDEITVPNYQKHWHVKFHLDDGNILVYSDIRRFGEVRFVSSLDETPIAAIAPEPFEPGAMPHYLQQLELKKWQEKSIKEAIMHHSTVSGCGNIYACEALYMTGLNPNTRVKNLSKQKREVLFKNIVEVLNLGIEYGGSSISSYRNTEGKAGSMQTRHQIYNKKICPSCGKSVTTKVIAGRNTHYCTNCQK